MNNISRPELTLTDASPSGGCGCGCGSSQPSTATESKERPTSATSQQYAVTGLTCGHCVGAVTSELEAIDGVSRVAVELVSGGVSTVSVDSEPRLTRDQVAAALDEAGDYHLTAA